jgi:O-antigen ligase
MLNLSTTNKYNNFYCEHNYLPHSYLIYYSYIFCLSSMFFVSNLFFGQKIFVYVVTTLSFSFLILSKRVESPNNQPYIFILSASNIYATLKGVTSPIFLACALYTFSIGISTLLYPKVQLDWAYTILYFSFSVLSFLLITVRLAREIDDFFEKTAFILSLACAVSTVINIFLFIDSSPDVTDIFNIRFYPRYGLVPDHYPTTSALTYAILCIGSINIYFTSKYKNIKIISAFVIFILLSAVFLTQTRGALLALLSIATIVFFYYRPKYRYYIVISITLVSFIFFILSGSEGGFIQRLDGHRLEIWKGFLALALDRPIFGYGERIQFLFSIWHVGNAGHAHNIILGAMTRGGVFGLISLLFILVKGMEHATRYGLNSANLIPFSFMYVIILAGFFDFEILIFMADWQWVSFWLPIAFAISCRYQSFQI